MFSLSCQLCYCLAYGVNFVIVHLCSGNVDVGIRPREHREQHRRHVDVASLGTETRRRQHAAAYDAITSWKQTSRGYAREFLNIYSSVLSVSFSSFFFPSFCIPFLFFGNFISCFSRLLEASTPSGDVSQLYSL